MMLLCAMSALWLGVMTSISPCPLATNIAAVSFLGRKVQSARQMLLAGACYTLGRMVTYVSVGAVVVWGMLSIPTVSTFLQKYMNKILGPLLILAGMLVLGLIALSFSGSIAVERTQRRAEKGGLFSAGLLGIIFALSFCPISAALFFGGLVPLALEHHSYVLLPALYGVGTALPVLAFAALVALGARFVGVAFNRLTQIEKWARRITGTIFIVVGVYYCLRHIFGLF